MNAWIKENKINLSREEKLEIHKDMIMILTTNLIMIQNEIRFIITIKSYNL